jgi:four helix bundle protein
METIYEQSAGEASVVQEGGPVRRFQDLFVWQRAHQLVLDIYELTKRFPKEELYGLSSQLRKSAVSVPSNIAEGFGRTSLADRQRFTAIAQGSLNETRYYLILAKDLCYTETAQLQAEAEQLAKMLYAYAAHMTAKENRRRPLRPPILNSEHRTLNTLLFNQAMGKPTISRIQRSPIGSGAS